MSGVTLADSMTARARTGSLLQGSGIYLFSNGLNALIPFALLPILTRHLGPSGYGEVAMFQTLLVALAAVTGLSLQGAAGRKYFDFDTDRGELGYFIGACLQLLVVSTSIVFVAAFLWKDALAAWLGIRATWIPWAVGASACGFIVLIRMTQWQVRKQAMKYGALQVTQSLLNMGVSMLLVVALGLGADGRIAAMIGVPIVLAVVALVLLYRDGLLGIAWRPQYLKEAARYGVPLVPHVVGLFLLGTVDRFVVNRELGLAQAGIYMVAVQVAMVLALVFDSINNSYVPWLSERLKRDDAAEKRQIVRYTYWYFAFAVATAGVAFVAGPWAVTAIAGAEYAPAGRAVGWLALGQAFAGMYLMVTNYILYSKRTGLLSAATVCSGLFGLALLPPLTRRLGLTGASIAFASAMLVRFLLTWWVAHRRHPMPWALRKSDLLTQETVNAQ